MADAAVSPDSVSMSLGTRPRAIGSAPPAKQFTNHVINTRAVSGLVKRSDLIGVPWRAQLTRDIGELTDGV
jgi:hypothetical protein